jgi:hypothetical protein
MAERPNHNAPESKRATLLHRIRLKVFALLVGMTLAVIGAVSWAALPVWPVLGVAVATVAFVVNSLTSRLNDPVCWTCGDDLSKQASGEYGIMCPKCGSLNIVPEDSAGEPPASV